MSKSALEVIAEVERDGEVHKYDPFDPAILGTECAERVIAKLDQHGYRIIRHRVVSDEEASKSPSK